MLAEPIRDPAAALANVLARIILACSIAAGGRLVKSIRFRIRERVRALPGEVL
jgi:hypothetical protein